MLRYLTGTALIAALLLGVAAKLPASAATALYTYKDFGAPPASLAPQGDAQPVVFNNTGQMAGVYTPAVGGPPYCLAYTGSKWITITDPTARLCEVWSMNDAKSGTFDVVGRIGSSFEVGDKSGYYSVVGPSSATMHVFGAVYPSSTVWVNNAGQAVGRGDYGTPASNFDGPPALVFGATATTTLLPVDPCVTSPGTLCPTPVRENTPGYGGNHYREINSAGTYFAIDLANSNIMEGTIGKSSASVDLPLNVNNVPCFGPLGIDDAAGFFYTECPNPNNNAIIYVYRYDVTAKKSTVLPTLAGSDCTLYLPYTMNAKGAVYGLNGNCTKSPSVMWIYDPVKKVTTNLSALLPATAGTYCGGGYTLKALNDLGQILINIGGCSGNPPHWGILYPPT
jgi:hypothetical protein